jgi:hypothetical protein
MIYVILTLSVTLELLFTVAINSGNFELIVIALEYIKALLVLKFIS